jgi:hypothetical protein
VASDREADEAPLRRASFETHPEHSLSVAQIEPIYPKGDNALRQEERISPSDLGELSLVLVVGEEIRSGGGATSTEV